MTFIYFIIAVLIGLLPALLIYFTGQAVANAPDDPLRRQKWALFWLEITALILIPYIVFAPTFSTSPAGLVLALMAPTLWVALGFTKNILGPLTGRGQVWCYQAGDDFYRLGFVWFQRYYANPDASKPFTEPYDEIKVPYAAGTPPSGEWMCDQELRWSQLTGGL